MKIKKTFAFLAIKPAFLNGIAGIVMLTMAAQNAEAATRTKAVSGTDLALGAAWDTLPTTSDIATWATGSLGGALTLGSTQTWGAIDLEDAIANLSLSGSALTLSGGQTIQGIASSGLYLAAAGKDLAMQNAIALGANQVWTVGAGRTLTTGGVTSGAFTLGYYGTGTYLINGINTNSGNLTIDAATVRVSTGATLFCASLGWSGRTVTVTNGGILEANNFANGAGNLWGQCGDGANNVTLNNGTFKMLGTTMDSGVNKGISVSTNATGHFSVATGTSATWAGSYGGRDFTVNTGGTLVFDGGGNFETSRYISGAGNVTKNDGGTLKLTQNNTFSGTLTVSAGILEAAPATLSGTPSPIGNNSTVIVNSGGSLLFSTNRGAGYHSGAVTINGGTITANGTDLSFANGKTLTFDTAPGTFDGTGQWRRRDANNKIAVTAAASGSTLSVAELNLLDNSPTIEVADGTHAVDLTVSSKLTGTTLTKTGAGTLALTDTNVGYTSALTITLGTLEIGGAGQLNSGTYAGNISNSGTLSLNTSANQTLSGVISGTGALSQSGTGTLTLSNSNTFGGALTITTGTLEMGGAGQLGSGNYTSNITNNGTLALNSTANQTLGGNISGTGSLTKSNTGTLTLSGTNSYSGKTAITNGTISIAADSGLGTAPATVTADHLTLNGGSLAVSASGQTLAVNRGVTLGAGGGKIDISALGVNGGLTVNSKITGTGALTLAGAGDTSASGGGNGYMGINLMNTANDFTGDVTLTAGLVSYANNSVFGNAANKIILNGGGLIDPETNVSLSRNIEVQSGGGCIRLWSASNVTWSSNFTGTGTLNRTDGGTLTLSGDLSGYTGTFNNQQSTTTLSNKIVGGALNISSGTVNLNGTGTAGAISQSGGSLAIGGSANVTAGAISNSSTNASFNIATGGVLNATSYYANYAPSFTVNGTLNLSGNLIFSTGGSSVNGTGTINAAGYVNQNYTTATFNALHLNLGANGITNGSPTGNAVIFNGTTLGAYANWSSSLGLTLTGANTINTLDSKDSATARTITLSGALSGAGSLTKTGTGTLTLSGTNTYAGSTAVSNGVLRVNGSLTGVGAVSVASGATLGGTGTIAGAVTVNGGNLSPGTSVQSLTTGALTLTNGSTFIYEMDSSADSSIAADFQKVTGSLSLAGTISETVYLTLNDLSSSPTAFAPNTTLALINYAGAWNGGFFTYGTNQLTDGEVFSDGLNTWKITYGASTGGLNFANEYTPASGSFVNLTAVPEPGSLFAIGCLIGSGALLRRRGLKIEY